MAPVIEELKTGIEKAVKQAKVLSKQAIPWIMVPRDANRNGIEVQVLWFEGKFHDYVFKHPDIFVMPVYSLEFDADRVSIIFDIYETGQNTFNIKVDAFRAYVKDLMAGPEVYI